LKHLRKIQVSDYTKVRKQKFTKKETTKRHKLIDVRETDQTPIPRPYIELKKNQVKETAYRFRRVKPAQMIDRKELSDYEPSICSNDVSSTESNSDN
jgi:hypothetical protein